MEKHYNGEAATTGKKQTKRNHRFRRVMGVTMAICLVGATGATSFATVLAEDAVVTSSVIDGTSHYAVSLPSTDVDDLLDAANITLGDNDVVVKEDDSTGTTVTVKRSMQAVITTEDNVMTVEGHCGDTVGQLIESAGITLNQLDAVTPSVDTIVYGDTDITITEQIHVYVLDQQVVRSYVVPKGTVAQAVAAAGIELGEDDFVSNPKEQATDGMMITVNRVTYETVKKTKTIDFAVTEEESDDLDVGTSEIKQEGETGKKVVTYRQKLVNGEVAETEKVSETVTKEPVDQIVVNGTKEENAAVTTAAGDLSYSSVITGTCTAYTGGGTTATGAAAQVGIVAVNPNQIPYGTRLYIASADGSYVYGYCVAGDTGGAMMAGEATIDLYMNTQQECINFGRRTMNIYILD